MDRKEGQSLRMNATKKKTGAGVRGIGYKGESRNSPRRTTGRNELHMKTYLGCLRKTRRRKDASVAVGSSAFWMPPVRLKRGKGKSVKRNIFRNTIYVQLLMRFGGPA